MTKFVVKYYRHCFQQEKIKKKKKIGSIIFFLFKI